MPLRPGLAVIQVTHKRIEGRRQKATPKRLLSAFCLLLYTLCFCLPAHAQSEKGQKQAPAGPSDTPFYDYVETAYNRHILAGYGDGTFRPNANIGRGQFTKMLVIAEGWPLDNPATARFSDVPAGSAYFQYVETAVSRQVISG